MDENQLLIEKIFGTSARNQSNFAVQDNLIGYTASGGVVICELDKNDPLKVVNQRFFVANGAGSAVLADISPDSRRDSFGYAINDPIIVGNEHASNVNINDVDLSSPSKLKDRVRTINCIAISPNKKILAVGETGYQPRIILYSLAGDSSNGPIGLIYEHLFGIGNLVFSPDSKFLCSLGLANDGYLNVWRIEANSGLNISLCARNKCSSLVNQVIWHEDLLVTLGLRLIKVWKFDINEITPTKVVSIRGKNVLLTNFISSNFINGEILNSDEMLIITDQADLVLLKLNFEKLQLVNLESPGFMFNSITIDHDLNEIWLGSPENITSLSINNLKPCEDDVRPIKSPSSPIKGSIWRSNIIKLNILNDRYLIYLSDNEEINVFNKSDQSIYNLIPSVLKNISGATNCSNGELVIFSKDGSIKRFQEDKLESILQHRLPSNELIENALTAVDINSHGEVILGDKYGSLYILNSEDKSVKYQTKAHESTINEVVYYEFEEIHKFIITISRDRMIQVFYKTNEEWDLMQTLALHRGNLLRLIVEQGRIFVCSADRTISIHRFEKVEEGKVSGISADGVVILQEKVLSFKNSPVNMKIFQNELIVTTSDKTLMIFKIGQNYENRSLKLFNESNDSLQVENLLIRGPLCYVSSNDRSLRIFNFHSGKLLSTNWGHSDTILGLFINQEKKLISIGNDGCLFVWDFQDVTNKRKSNITSTINNNSLETPIYAKVTRKIIPTTPLNSPGTNRIKESPKLPPMSPVHKFERSPKLTPSGGSRLRSVSPIPKPTTNRRSSIIPNKSNGILSPARLQKTDVKTKLSQCVDNNDDSIFRVLAGLRNDLSKDDKYSVQEKGRIKVELLKILEMIDDDTEQRVLESYSDKLIDMFKRKLDKLGDEKEGQIDSLEKVMNGLSV